MERPFRTGLMFGAGFSIVLALLMLVSQALLRYVTANMIDRTSSALRELQTWKRPTLVKAEPALRNGDLVILLTVRNDQDQPLHFDAEAVIFGKTGDYYDTCPTSREFYFEPGEELRFRANCPAYGVDQTQTLATLGRIEVQFFEPDPASKLRGLSP
jgi:hypothetical protein